MAKKNKEKNKKVAKATANNPAKTNPNVKSKDNLHLDFTIQKLSKTLKCDFYLVQGTLSTKAKYSYVAPILTALASKQEQGGISLEDLSQELYGDKISRIHKLRQVVSDLADSLVVTEDPTTYKILLTQHGVDLHAKDNSFSPVAAKNFLLVTCNYPLLNSKVLACKPLVSIDSFSESIGNLSFQTVKFDANMYWHPGYNAKFLVDEEGNHLIDSYDVVDKVPTNDVELLLQFAQSKNSELVFNDLDSGKVCSLVINDLVQLTPYGETTNYLNSKLTHTTLLQNQNKVNLSGFITNGTNLSLISVSANAEHKALATSTTTPTSTHTQYFNVEGDFTYQYLFGGDVDHNKYILHLNGKIPLIKGFDLDVFYRGIEQQVITRLKNNYSNFDEKKGFLKLDKQDYDSLTELEQINGVALINPISCKNIQIMANSELIVDSVDVRITLPIRPYNEALALNWLIDLVYYETKPYHIVSEHIFNNYMQNPNIAILRILKEQLKLKRFYRKDLIKILNQRQGEDSSDNRFRDTKNKQLKRELELLRKLRHGQFWDI